MSIKGKGHNHKTWNDGFSQEGDVGQEDIDTKNGEKKGPY